MPALVTNAHVETCLRELLVAEGYELSARRGYGETGVDIRAIRGAEDLCIEVIGFKSSAPARARDFYEVFFRAISRLDHAATKCVIALPARFGSGLPARAKHYGTAWDRIGQSFPELRIWLVDAEARSVTDSLWNEWLSSSTGTPSSRGAEGRN